MSQQAGISVVEMAKSAKEASRLLYNCDTNTKNQTIRAIAQSLRAHQAEILAANQQDLAAAQTAGLSTVMLDRLTLDPQRIENIAREAEQVASLDDPVGQEFDQRDLADGMHIRRRRVPLGVIGVIYESRPNVTIDVACLCLKTGNAVILRGGKETLQTNQVLAQLLQDVLQAHHLPQHAIQLISSPDRDLMLELLKQDAYIDMIIPRGGAGLHAFCRENSTIPVITGGIGVCHLYVDTFLDLDQAVPVIINAKVQRPTVCNALDTLLIHHSILPDLIPELLPELAKHGVEVRADILAYPYFEQLNYPKLVHSTHEDYGQEFLDLILSIRVVEDLDEAISHIAQFGSGHSDGILTFKTAHAEHFVNQVDSAAVYVNASTRFTDGAMFGLGAEVAVSTQKLHVRGPMALEGLTTYKWLIEGNWNVRP